MVVIFTGSKMTKKKQHAGWSGRKKKEQQCNGKKLIPEV